MGSAQQQLVGGGLVQRLDLVADPFAGEYSTEHFYAGAQRGPILEELQHYARFSQQPIMLYGPSGCGKTVLVKELLAALKQSMDCCVLQARQATDTSALMRAIAASFALRLDDDSSLCSFVEALRFTVLVDEEPEPVLLVVEDIHNVPEAMQHFLFELYAQCQGLMHLVLTSETLPPVWQQLIADDSASLKSITLLPLTTEEVNEYVLMKLCAEGYGGEEPLTPEQWSALHERSRGNLAAINQLVPPLLLGVEEGLMTRSWRLPVAHVAAIFILVAGLVVSYWYLDVSAQAPVSSREVVPLDIAAVVVSGAADAVPIGGVGVVAREDVKAELTAVIVKPDVVVAQKIAIERRRDTVGDTKGGISSVKLDPVPKSAPAPKVDSAVMVPAEATASSSAAAGRPLKLGARERRLLGLAESQYMLQVLGSRSEQSARDFVSRYVGRVPLTYYRSELKGESWYVVLAGPYADKVSAKNAVANLPQQLRRQKPWSKSLSVIHKDIRRLAPD